MCDLSLDACIHKCITIVIIDGSAHAVVVHIGNITAAVGINYRTEECDSCKLLYYFFAFIFNITGIFRVVFLNLRSILMLFIFLLFSWSKF